MSKLAFAGYTSSMLISSLSCQHQDEQIRNLAQQSLHPNIKQHMNMHSTRECTVSKINGEDNWQLANTGRDIEFVKKQRHPTSQRIWLTVTCSKAKL